MRSRLAESHQRRLWLIALVVGLVFGLFSGVFPHAEAQGYPPNYPKLPTGIEVDFDPKTPPVEPGVICKDQDYNIRALPWVSDFKNKWGRQRWMFNNRQGKVTVTKSLIGSISPAIVNLVVAYEAPAIFAYSSEKTGKDALRFHAQVPERQYNPGDGPEWRGSWETADQDFRFEVLDCHPNVSMNYTLHQSIATVFGHMADTKLEKQSDGTFAGDGSFEFEQFVDVAPCAGDFSAFSAPTHITGTVDDKTHQLKLNFNFGKAENEFSGSCPIKGGVSASHNINVATLGVTSATFPESGGGKEFSALGGQLTIIVTDEQNSGTALQIGG